MELLEVLVVGGSSPQTKGNGVKIWELQGMREKSVLYSKRASDYALRSVYDAMIPQKEPGLDELKKQICYGDRFGDVELHMVILRLRLQLAAEPSNVPKLITKSTMSTSIGTGRGS